MNGTAMAPTNGHPFVMIRPHHVRLKFSATSTAEANVRSNMRDFSPSVFSAASAKQDRPEKSTANSTKLIAFLVLI